MGVEIKRYLPAAALQPLIAHYWVGTLTGKPTATLKHKIFPSGYLELVVHLSQVPCRAKPKLQDISKASLHGLSFRTTPYVLPFKRNVETLGICFKPEALQAVFGVTAATFLNYPAKAAETLSPFIAAFRARIEKLTTTEERVSEANSYFLEQVQSVHHRQGFVEIAADLIRRQKGETSVESLSQEVCIGIRQLEREFKNQLGLSPKTYMRITRLYAALELFSQNPSISLAQLSYLSGYSDQAHFSKEFRQIIGELPSVYVAEQRRALAC